VHVFAVTQGSAVRSIWRPVRELSFGIGSSQDIVPLEPPVGEARRVETTLTPESAISHRPKELWDSPAG